jgi:hypothetical protein
MASIGKGNVFGENWTNVLRMNNWNMRIGNNAEIRQFTMMNPADTFITNREPQQQNATMTVGSTSSGQSVGGTSILIKASGKDDDDDPVTALYQKIAADQNAEDEPGVAEDLEISRQIDAAKERTVQEAKARFEPHWQQMRQSGTPITSLEQLGMESGEISKTLESMNRLISFVELRAPQIVIAAEIRITLDGMGVSTMSISEYDRLVKLVDNGEFEEHYLDYTYERFHQTTGLQIRFSQLTELDARTRKFFADLEGNS